MAKISTAIFDFSRQEITQIFKKARAALKHPGLTILVAPKTKEFGRLLVVTSRKIGNAVKRNKVRRRLKAIFYEEKLYERGLDCIVIVKQPGTELGFDDLIKIMTQALSKTL